MLQKRQKYQSELSNFVECTINFVIRLELEYDYLDIAVSCYTYLVDC